MTVSFPLLLQWKFCKVITVKGLHFCAKGSFFTVFPLPFDCKGLQCIKYGSFGDAPSYISEIYGMGTYNVEISRWGGMKFNAVLINKGIVL